MNHNQKTIIRLAWWAILIHAILIAMTIAEVFLYSMLVNPGQESVTYERHANQSGPYIGIIAGFFAVYWAARRLKGRDAAHKTLICIGLPIWYIILDVVMLMVAGTDVSDNLGIFGISYATKILAGYVVLWRT